MAKTVNSSVTRVTSDDVWQSRPLGVQEVKRTCTCDRGFSSARGANQRRLGRVLGVLVHWRRRVLRFAKRSTMAQSPRQCYVRSITAPMNSCPVIDSSCFLANVNSRSRSLYAIARVVVACHDCLSSVTLVRPAQPVEIFMNVSSPFGTLATRWHSRKILRRSSQGNPSGEG